MQQPQKPFSESGTSPPLRVIVQRIDLIPSCTVGTCTGLDPEGNEVTFVGDWRPLLQIAGNLKPGKTVEVTLVGSQIVCWEGVAQP